MASLAFPREIFPSEALFEQYYHASEWDGYAHELRTCAWESAHDQSHIPSDKELLRFMAPRSEWQKYSSLEPASPRHTDLGGGAWIADYASLPFLPEQLKEVKQIFEQPFSIAHFVGATFTRLQVLYVPAGADLTIDLSSFTGPYEGAPYDGLSVGRETTSDFALAYSAPLLFVIIESGASVVLTEAFHAFLGMKARLLVGFIGPQAQLTFISDQQHGSEDFGMQHELWHLGQEASLKSMAALTGGCQTWHIKEFTLEEAACVEHVSLAALRDHEQSALITKQLHQGPAGRSSVVVKSVLQGRAHSFYRGMIDVHESAVHTQADQQQRALLLSSAARICAIPSLEVATHEVQCRHGSAAGRFNKEEMGYMLSRGLDKGQAENILIEGFYNGPLSGYDSSLTGAMRRRLQGYCRLRV